MVIDVISCGLNLRYAKRFNVVATIGNFYLAGLGWLE